MLRKTKSRTSPKVAFRASISICLMALLMSSAYRGSSPEESGGSRPPLAQRSHAHGDAGCHGASQGDGSNVVSLDTRRLDRPNLFDESRDVGRQLVLVEAHLADAGMDVAALVGAIFHLAGLELADRAGDVTARRDNRAGLGSRH